MSIHRNTFRQLIVWKKAKELTLYVYGITKTFPQSERFHMVDQLRRASSSVMANIAEGNERDSKRDCMRFLQIARGSLVEVDNFVDLAFDLHYLNEEQYKSCLEHVNKTAYLLYRFRDSQLTNERRS